MAHKCVHTVKTGSEHFDFAGFFTWRAPPGPKVVQQISQYPDIVRVLAARLVHTGGTHGPSDGASLETSQDRCLLAGTQGPRGSGCTLLPWRRSSSAVPICALSRVFPLRSFGSPSCVGCAVLSGRIRTALSLAQHAALYPCLQLALVQSGGAGQVSAGRLASLKSTIPGPASSPS
jgi:hypothetical protein